MSDSDPLINRSHSRYAPWYNIYLRPCLAEFFGTMLFVFVGTMATNNNATLLQVAMAHGLALAVLVACMAKLSGSHYNPAVTLGVFLAGEINWVKAILYVKSQLIGAMVGSGLTRLALPYETFKMASGGGHALADNVTAGEGVVCEIVLTAVLVVVVLMTAVDSESQTTLAPLCIGFAVAADIIAGGAISGASMNPARSFGPAIAASSIDGISTKLWKYHYVYWIGPAIGACFSGLWYRLVFAACDKNVLFHERH